MKINKSGKIVLLAGLILFAAAEIYINVLRDKANPDISLPEKLFSAPNPTLSPQKTLAPEEGLILIVHQEAGKMSLARGSYLETFQFDIIPEHYPDPVLSPEGTRIAFRDADGYLNIYDGFNQTNTTFKDTFMGGLHPFGWSPDGQKIAYSCPELPASICIFTLNTGDIKTFANMQDGPQNSYGGYAFAGWSSDGEKIGIMYYDEPYTHYAVNYYIGTIKLLDVETEEITDVFSESDRPDIKHLQDAVLSPDGSSFLFSAMSEDYFAVYQVQTDGSGLKRITGDEYKFNILHPVWKPDGQGFITIAPEFGKDVDHARQIPTVFDLCGNMVTRIDVELGGIPTSWIGIEQAYGQE